MERSAMQSALHTPTVCTPPVQPYSASCACFPDQGNLNPRSYQTIGRRHAPRFQSSFSGSRPGWQTVGVPKREQFWFRIDGTLRGPFERKVIYVDYGDGEPLVPLREKHWHADYGDSVEHESRLRENCSVEHESRLRANCSVNSQVTTQFSLRSDQGLRASSNILESIVEASVEGGLSTVDEPQQLLGRTTVERFVDGRTPAWTAFGPLVGNKTQVNGSAEATTVDTPKANAAVSCVEPSVNSNVMIVDNVSIAENVVELLRGKYKNLVHACDTEVAEIDPKKQSPVGHGRMTCFSIYCGPDADFGDGKSRLWVDVLGGGPGVLNEFKPYFEDPSIKKVWHNYSFDRHILGNHSILASGFYADTMHLARLWDSGRSGAQGGYSLEALTSDKSVMEGHWNSLDKQEMNGKGSMKQIFGQPNMKKNGEEGKLKVLPPVEELQTKPEWREKFIHYSAFDTVCTWCLWESLRTKLTRRGWKMEKPMKQEGRSMYDFYMEYWKPFGEILVEMESQGMLLDREHLARIQEVAVRQQKLSESKFRTWASQYCSDAVYMNVGSDAQIRQLLYGGMECGNGIQMPASRTFNTANDDKFVEEGRKLPKKTRPFVLEGLKRNIPILSLTTSGVPAVGGPVLKALAGNVAVDYSIPDGTEEPCERMDIPSVAMGSSKSNSSYGEAYSAFGGGEEGKEACMAIAALCEVASINTLISNFIQPLQGGDIMGPNGRVHCSLNINTETGRLSARRPSLQNQPALEKDRYKIRQAFCAAPGNSLIVADYGQLELRILAHLSNCKSMLKAFEDGGDFHSRTAMNMYDHVWKAVERGDVVLEWAPNAVETNLRIPLLKDVFGAERRKAKMLNFSIAYGKTAAGLAKDWKVTTKEAQATLDLWYNDRLEVRQWQEEQIREAFVTQHVHTLLGRCRRFPDVKFLSTYMKGHVSRAAINTPVQGSAADVAMCAMIEISRNKLLAELGWKLLLQVHDEMILEGPSETADVAKDLVVKAMSYPFSGQNVLRVDLAVDAKYAQNWYAAK